MKFLIAVVFLAEKGMNIAILSGGEEVLESISKRGLGQDAPITALLKPALNLGRRVE